MINDTKRSHKNPQIGIVSAALYMEPKMALSLSISRGTKVLLTSVASTTTPTAAQNSFPE